MRTRTFFDNDHAFRYLTQSIIRVKDNPVYVTHTQQADDGYVLSYDRLPLPPSSRAGKSGTRYTIHSRDEVDMNPLPLGMLAVHQNDKVEASTYLSRLPQRAWKIGLTEYNIQVSKISDKEYTRLSLRDLIYLPAFLKTVRGDYPSMKETIRLSNERKLPIAFSRRFAIEEDKLLYKTFIVPVGEIQNNKPVLSDNFKYLAQVLEEDLHG